MNIYIAVTYEYFLGYGTAPGTGDPYRRFGVGLI